MFRPDLVEDRLQKVQAFDLGCQMLRLWHQESRKVLQKTVQSLRYKAD